MAIFKLQLGFAGMIGVDSGFEIEAPANSDIDKLRDILFDKYDWDLRDMLEATEVADLGDGDYDVTINFNGFIGADETYSVYAEDEDEAIANAIEEALYDITIEDYTPTYNI